MHEVGYLGDEGNVSFNILLVVAHWKIPSMFNLCSFICSR